MLGATASFYGLLQSTILESVGCIWFNSTEAKDEKLWQGICPVAIKYNKILVDAFWNSRQQSFTTHLLQLMTSWAVVCDVWYLEPHNLKPGETSIEFAERVRDIISHRAGLKKAPWDGYLKYSRPCPKHRESK
ncbi:hypothetical protein ACSQ67_003911 [Phaseolus vulgaris]